MRVTAIWTPPGELDLERRRRRRRARAVAGGCGRLRPRSPRATTRVSASNGEASGRSHRACAARRRRGAWVPSVDDDARERRRRAPVPLRSRRSSSCRRSTNGRRNLDPHQGRSGGGPASLHAEPSTRRRERTARTGRSASSSRGWSMHYAQRRPAGARRGPAPGRRRAVARAPRGRRAGPRAARLRGHARSAAAGGRRCGRSAATKPGIRIIVVTGDHRRSPRRRSPAASGSPARDPTIVTEEELEAHDRGPARPACSGRGRS